MKAGKYVSVAKSPSFQPATGSATARLAEQPQSKLGSGKSSADTGKGRKRRIALPFRMIKAQENQGFLNMLSGQDDINGRPAPFQAKLQPFGDKI